MTPKKKKPNPDYDHQAGGDQYIPLPEHLKELEEFKVKAQKYKGYTVLKGGPYDTIIMDEIIGKINNNESVVIAITGPPGTGKTYMGEYIAQILDKRFHVTDTPPPPPNRDHGQVTFEREHIMYLTGADSPLKRGQVILMDEVHFGMGARGWQNRDQQEITNYVAAIRSKGYVLIFIVLNTAMVDKMVRDFVINYEIHVTNRGVGTVYRRWFPQFGTQVFKKRLGRIRVPLPDSGVCNKSSCLRCKWLNPDNRDERCMTLRAVYERRKEWFLNSQAEEDEEEQTIKNLDKSEKMGFFFQDQDMLYLNKHGTLDVGSVAAVLKKHDQPYGKQAAYDMKNYIEAHHQEIIENIALRKIAKPESLLPENQG